MLTEVKKIPDDADAYRGAIVDWVEHGSESRSRSSPTRWSRARNHAATTRHEPPRASSWASTSGAPSGRSGGARGGARRTGRSPATGRTSARPGRSSPRPTVPPPTISSRTPTTSTRATGSTTSSPGEAGAAYTVLPLSCSVSAGWNTSVGTVIWKLRQPVMVAGFTGWNDAADAASTAVRALIEGWGAHARSPASIPRSSPTSPRSARMSA